MFPLLLLLACVPKVRHEALEMDLDATKAELVARTEAKDREIVDLRAALSAEQAEVVSLEAQLEELRGRLAAEEKRSKGLVDEKAALLSDKARMKGSLDEMKTALAELEARKATAEKRVAEYRDLLGRFRSLIDAGKLQVKIVDGRMVVALATDVLFASGSAALSPEGKAAIQEVTRVLVTIPGKDYQVEGHTDNVPIATAQYPSNWELAAARSITVVRAMIEAGMPANRASAAAYGEYNPVKDNGTAEGRAANRRIEIVVVPDLTGLPGFDELTRAGQGG